MADANPYALIEQGAAGQTAAPASAATAVSGPNPYALIEQGAPDPNDPGAAVAAVRGAGQGATMGWMDRLGALGAASPLPGKAPIGSDVPNASVPDVLAGGARLIGEDVAPSIFGDGGHQAYDNELSAQRGATQAAETAHPIATLGGELAGGIATAAATPMLTPFKAAEGAGMIGRALPAIGNLAATGAGYGAVAGAASSPDLASTDTLTDAAKGAALGAVAAPVVGGALGAAGKVLGGVADHFTAQANPAALAQKLVAKPLQESAADVPALADKVQAAQDAGVDQYTLADAAGPKLQGLVGTVTRQNGPGKAAAQEFLQNRQIGTDDLPSQADRIGGAVSDLLGDGDASTDIANAAKANATYAQPLYDKALQAPLPPSPDLANIADRPAVQQALQDGERIANNEGVQLPTIFKDQSGNVLSTPAFQAFQAGQAPRLDAAVSNLLGSDGALATSDRIMAERSAQADQLYTAARQQPVEITQPLIDVSSRLNAAGAVGDAQHMAALAGEPWDLNSLSTWDNMKRSLDDKIQSAQQGGNNNLGRLYGNARSQMVDELSRQNPTYAEARQTFAGHSEMLDSLQAGQDSIKNSVTREAMGQQLAPLTDGQAQMYRVGAANALREKLAQASDSGDPTKAVAGNQALRDKLTMLAPSPDAMDTFNSAIANEKRQFEAASQPDARTWHYALQSIEGKLAKEVDPETGGILSPEGKALAANRDVIRGALRQNPDYAKADDIAGSLSDVVAAARRGSKAPLPSTTPDQVAADLQGISGPAQQAYLRGASGAQRAKIANMGDGANKTRQVGSNPALRQKFKLLAEAGGAPNAMDKTLFDTRVGAENDMATTRNKALFGSDTTNKLTEDQAFARLLDGASMAGDVIKGNVPGILDTVLRYVGKVSPAKNGKVLDEVRKIILDPNPEKIRAFADTVSNSPLPKPAKAQIARSLLPLLPKPAKALAAPDPSIAQQPSAEKEAQAEPAPNVPLSEIHARRLLAAGHKPEAIMAMAPDERQAAVKAAGANRAGLPKIDDDTRTALASVMRHAVHSDRSGDGRFAVPQ